MNHPPAPYRVAILALAFASAMAASGGCELKGDRVAADGSISSEDWPFVPAAVRVHPFTTIERDGEAGEPMLKAHVELVDQLGDVTKGVGELRFELYAESERAAGPASGRQIMRWEAPLATLEHNRRHWDSITRTYVFRLKADQKPPKDAPLRLDVQFTDAAGKRMTASAPVSSR